MKTRTPTLDTAMWYSLMTLTKMFQLEDKVKNLFGEGYRKNGRSGMPERKKKYRKSVLECLNQDVAEEEK